MGFLSKLTKPKWQKLAARAEKAERSESWADAHRYYSGALEQAPEAQRSALEAKVAECAERVFETHLAAGAEFLESGAFERAAERFELALDFAQSAEEKERARARLRDVDAAGPAADDSEFEDTLQDREVSFEMLLAQLPDDIGDRYDALGEAFETAVVASHNDRPEEAVAYFREAAESAPDDPAIQFELGRCLAHMREMEEAVEAFRRAEELAPDWIAAKLVLTEACWEVERFELAEAALQRAIDAEDGINVEVYTAVCRTALLTKSPDYGLEAAEVALEVDPGHRNLHLLKGQLLEMAGRDEEAIEAYEYVVSRNWYYDSERDRLVFDREAGLLAASNYFRRGEQLDRAEELLRAALSVTPPAARWQMALNLAEVQIKAGHEDEAHDTLKDIDRTIPEDQVLARMRVAELMGDEDTLNRLLEELSEEDRERWESRATAEDAASG
jgi:tetratricopeptide (TPR) repeat protein